MKYELSYSTTKNQRNRFDINAVVKNPTDTLDIQVYTIKNGLSWAELARTMFSWFNDPDIPNALVNNVVNNGRKKNAS